MTELVLKLALSSFAAEAREHLLGRLAAGQEISFEIDEGPGESSPLYSYVPQTAQFIERNVAGLRELTAFGPACAAVESSGVAASYLEQRGMAVPASPQRRAEQLILVFCEELWRGSEDFSIDESRLDRIVREIEFGSAEGVVRGTSVLCPLVGLQLPLTKLELGIATIVRSEVTDLPAEALQSEGMGRAAWEPQFVAVADCVEGQQPAEVIAAQLHELITVMRLLRPGGIALGPYAWTQSGEGTWRRISTGSSRPRGGGYVLGEADAAELADLTRKLAARSKRSPALAWAIDRFEMGCERSTIFEALSDHLLALRGMLEGGGPAGATLPMRISALRSEPESRGRLRATLERATLLESGVMRGTALGDEESLQLAAEVEDHVREILRDAARGRLGDDLRATADEILVADGLAVGHPLADMGETSEWEPPLQPGPGMPGIEVFAAKTAEVTSHDRGTTNPYMDLDSAEIAVTRVEEETQAMDISDVVTPIDRARRSPEAPARRRTEEHEGRSRTGSIRRASVQRPAVRDFFPPPETTDWSIGELRFDRS